MARGKVWTGLLVVVLLVGALVPAGRTTAPAAAGSVDDLSTLTGYWRDLYPDQFSSESATFTEQFEPELLAKAEPDECFNGPGVPYTGTVPVCPDGIPKVNQAYVWGMAKPGDEVWFGTGPNIHCLVLGSYLGITTTIQTDSYVCEFGASQLSPPLPATAGDWRPPDLFRYDTLAASLVQVHLPDPLISATLGIRSGGTLGDVVLLGGPGLAGGINLFAFDASSDEYLGSTTLPQYNNIRKWIEVGGVLYTGVRDAATGGGHVLRWTGSLSDPFRFEVVANLGSEVAELAVHDGRLFVTTWPNLTSTPPEQASLYMSPPIPPGGLTAADADAWESVWQAGDYEPDPVTAVTYGGGALYSFAGQLYWGTMHVPFTAALAHFTYYGESSGPLEAVAALMGTHRAVSIFRGDEFGAPEAEIELLYGAAFLPVYVPPIGWLLLPNNMKTAPLYGESGLDNFYNNYTWTMAEYAGALYVGTMDWSYLLADGLPQLIEYLGLPRDATAGFPGGEHGADLFRFASAGGPAEVVSDAGLGNPTSYGVRTMISDDALYLGMANPMNLLTDPDGAQPLGGWELIRLGPGPEKSIHLPLILR